MAIATVSPGVVTPGDLETYRAAFEADPSFRQAMNAVANTPVGKVALDRRQVAQIDHSFSVHLTENPATSQKSSGRCWLFAALNTFRYRVQDKLKVKEGFELSQNYMMFWDKLEKANFFLENILITLDEPVGSRLLDHLLRDPIQDGGQWDMVVNLVEKYGVLPKSAMPETESSSSTGQLNHQVTAYLRDCACLLREAYGHGDEVARLRELKGSMMASVYRMLCIHLGEPPTEFDWQWRDKDREFHRRGTMTPQEFYREFVNIELDEYVCLIHDPRPGHPGNAVYTVKFLGNVAGGRPTTYVNTELSVMKEAAAKQLEDGHAVWFGCDVGKFLDRDLGVMDPGLFDYSLVYGVDLLMSKAQRLMYGHSQMTHAMVFTGVDLAPDGLSRRWRVENSWSDTPGDKGFFQMSDVWFDEFMYEVVVHKNHVPEKVLGALAGKTIELEPWDPMGSLA